MRELVPCSGCRRHVATKERTCPFCASALAPARPQRVLVAQRLGRAAMLSAVLAACESKPADPLRAAPVPVQGSAGAGSGADDLEQLLDGDSRVVERAPPIDAGLPDATTIAQQRPVDAGAPVDAGVDPAVAERRRKRVEAERRRREQLRIEQDRLQLEELQRMNHYEHAKPYGAPPARRRVV